MVWKLKREDSGMSDEGERRLSVVKSSLFGPPDRLFTIPEHLGKYQTVGETVRLQKALRN